MAGKFVIAARAEEELHTTPKLTNQLFEDSHNASFVSVVSWISCLWYRRIHILCVMLCYIPHGTARLLTIFFHIVPLLYISCVRDNESVLWFLSSFSYSHTSSSDQPTCHHHNYITFFYIFHMILVLSFHFFSYIFFVFFSFHFITFFMFSFTHRSQHQIMICSVLCVGFLLCFLCSGCVMCAMCV